MSSFLLGKSLGADGRVVRSTLADLAEKPRAVSHSLLCGASPSVHARLARRLWVLATARSAPHGFGGISQVTGDTGLTGHTHARSVTSCPREALGPLSHQRVIGALPIFQIEF